MSLHESSARILSRSASAGSRVLLSSKGLVKRFSPAIAAHASSVLTPFIPTELARWRARRNVATLGRLGDLEVRLAITPLEIRRAQALRYRVFYEEMSAVADFRTRQTRRDADRFDRFCDHLLVVDHTRKSTALGRPAEIVGTYRLLREDGAWAAGGFYSDGEFDLAPLLHRKAGERFLELGRSCVLPEYRNKRTLELLWHGIWAYVLRHRVDVMIGCASLEGTEPEKLALPLSFLHHYCGAPKDWRVSAHADRRVEMNLLPEAAIDARAALRSLPPLIKGYLRLGAFVGDGAVIDRQFGTIDVAIVLPVAAVATRYVDYFRADAGRYAVREALKAEDAPLVAA
jgi:L-ornithine Nalpha-acyltransferase